MATRKKRHGRRTGSKAATAAGRALRNPKARPSTKTAAASALAQAGRRARTGPAAASSAGRALARKGTLPNGRRAAASALSQARRRRPSRKA